MIFFNTFYDFLSLALLNNKSRWGWISKLYKTIQSLFDICLCSSFTVHFSISAPSLNFFYLLFSSFRKIVFFNVECFCLIALHLASVSIAAYFDSKLLLGGSTFLNSFYIWREPQVLKYHLLLFTIILWYLHVKETFSFTFQLYSPFFISNNPVFSTKCSYANNFLLILTFQFIRRGWIII